jgi:hypothetical protein
MQILRFKSSDNLVYTGFDYHDGSARIIEGDIFSDFSCTEHRKTVKEFLYD